MIKKNQMVERVLYLGRMVEKANFRTFVYNADSKRLVNSYQEYKEAISTGEWFDSKAGLESKKTRKPKDGADS